MGFALPGWRLSFAFVMSALWLSAGCSSSSSSEKEGTRLPRGGSSGAGAAGRGGADAGGTAGGAGTNAGGAGSGGDSGVRDGAAGEGSVRDGGSDASLDGSAGALPCSSGPGGIFCDDFEAATSSKWSRHSQASDGRTTRITTPVHGGQGAIRSVKSAPGPSDPLYADVLGARTSGHLYLRTYLYVPSGFAISAVDSAASLLVLGESGGALGGLSFVLWQDALSLTIAGAARSEVKAAFTLPRNRWNCVQIDFGIGQNENARLRVNGQLVAQGARDTRMTTSYGRLWVGVNWIHEKQTETVQALYDDLVVSTRDVPCD